MIHPSRASHYLRSLLAASLLITGGSVHAQMQVDCFAEIDCRTIVADAIAPAILEKYPGNQYKIVVFASQHDSSEGGGASYAFVGLSEKVSARGVDLTVLPLRRFSASQPWLAGRETPTGTDARRVGPTVDALRAAIGQMNTRCASAADCPVFTAYR